MLYYIQEREGTYDLKFIVDKNIEADFVCNKNTKIYDILLEIDKDNEREFFHTFTREENKNLEVIFVNHFSDRSERNYLTLSKKPEIIIGNV